jgi:Na+/H+-dicarboxylate symporter
LSAVLFNIPLSTHTDPSSRIINNLFTSESDLAGSRPLFTIFLAVCFGFLGSKWKRLHDFLEGIQSRFFQLAKNLRLAIVLFILLLGISVGVRFGAQLGLTNYLLMTCYTLLLCLTWASFYFFVLLRLAPTKCTKGVIKNYYLPTAVFAAGTCSSLITLPLNLVNIKKQGVSSKIADFVLPIGSVINLDASALA